MIKNFKPYLKTVIALIILNFHNLLRLPAQKKQESIERLNSLKTTFFKSGEEDKLFSDTCRSCGY